MLAYVSVVVSVVCVCVYAHNFNDQASSMSDGASVGRAISDSISRVIRQISLAILINRDAILLLSRSLKSRERRAEGGGIVLDEGKSLSEVESGLLYVHCARAFTPLNTQRRHTETQEL